MLSIAVNYLITSCAFCILAINNVGATEIDSRLYCDENVSEARQISRSGGAARRTGTHRLEVRTRGKVLRFMDEPPFEPLGGSHWLYCGFEANVKVHLIGLSKGSLFTGRLLFDNGAQSEGGHTVLFAPDKRTFLAIEQEDGMDGELWTVRTADGKLKWTGYAGTITKVNGIDTVESNFHYPSWTRSGELRARMACADSGQSQLVSLQKLGNEWYWRNADGCSASVPPAKEKD